MFEDDFVSLILDAVCFTVVTIVAADGSGDRIMMSKKIGV